jgi:8-oxo-dGTP pyrophosphatase MutT (NUDIX family)
VSQLEADLRRAFAGLEPRPADVADEVPRAAVAMIMAPPDLAAAGRSGPSLEGNADILFIRRAELDGDPWSGHMAFPGGRQSAEDMNLIATARRETREETGIVFGGTDVIGRLDDYHPSSPGLPPIVIAPFVVWLAEKLPIEPNHEIAGHLWVPIPVLADPVYRSSFTLHRDDRTRIFETIEYEGHTIWGLTFNIVSQFVMALANAGLLDRQGGRGA